MINILFGKPLYINQINFYFKKVASKIDEPRQSSKQTNNIPSKKGLFVLNKPKFKELRALIQKEIDEFTKGVMKYDADFEITTSWFTETNKGESSQFHNHNNCFLSGVLYIQVDPDSGSIVFEDFNDTRFMIPSTEYNQYNAKQFAVSPQNGLILMFPSEVWHQVNTNNSDITRYSLAFNVMPTGTFGDKTSDSQVNIKVIK